MANLFSVEEVIFALDDSTFEDEESDCELEGIFSYGPGWSGLVIADDFIEDGYGEDDTIGEEEESGLPGLTASIVQVLGEY